MQKISTVIQLFIVIEDVDKIFFSLVLLQGVILCRACSYYSLPLIVSQEQTGLRSITSSCHNYNKQETTLPFFVSFRHNP